MKRTTVRSLSLFELPVQAEQYADALRRGLSRTPKHIPCKFLYDAPGSALFERICDLPEYYLTRTEVAIMEAHAGDMARLLGPDCVLVELGSGASKKVRLLLDHLRSPSAYVPIDISREQLVESSLALAEDYPHLAILPLWADYTRPVRLPPLPAHSRRRVVYFSGSTIGNFGPEQATRFLTRIGQLAGPRGGVLIGVDLEKAPKIIEPAYDDAQGITAAFNLNLLERANREVGADFDPSHFRHRAVYDRSYGRVVISLVSLADQTVRVNGQRFRFHAGESILTEYSYKYRLAGFAELARRAGLEVAKVWTDPDQLFSVQYLTAPRGTARRVSPIRETTFGEHSP